MKKFPIIFVFILCHAALVVQGQMTPNKISSKLDFEGSQENLNLSTSGGGGGDDGGVDNQRPHYGIKNKKYDDSVDLNDGSQSTPPIAGSGSGSSSSNENRDERRRNNKGPTIHGVRVTVDTGGGGGGGGTGGANGAGGSDSFSDGNNRRSSKEYKESVEIIDSGGGKHKARIGIHTGITFEIIGDSADEKDPKDHSNSAVNRKQQNDGNRNDDSGSSSVLILKGRGGGGDSSSRHHHHYHHDEDLPRRSRPYNPKSSEWDPNFRSSSAADDDDDDGDGFGRHPSSSPDGYYPYYHHGGSTNTNTNTGYWSNFAVVRSGSSNNPPPARLPAPPPPPASSSWTTETPYHSRSILPYGTGTAADYKNPIWRECYCFSSSSAAALGGGGGGGGGGAYRDRRDATILFLTDRLAKSQIANHRAAAATNQRFRNVRILGGNQ